MRVTCICYRGSSVSYSVPIVGPPSPIRILVPQQDLAIDLRPVNWHRYELANDRDKTQLLADARRLDKRDMTQRVGFNFEPQVEVERPKLLFLAPHLFYSFCRPTRRCSSPIMSSTKPPRTWVPGTTWPSTTILSWIGKITTYLTQKRDGGVLADLSPIVKANLLVRVASACHDSCMLIGRRKR